MVAMTADAQELQHSGGVEIAGSLGAAATVGAWTIVLEVVLGTWVLLLFLLALAWDPIDRRMGARRRSIAARAAQRAQSAPPAVGNLGGASRVHDTGAYAILPAE
jgi:hypothetical protein